MYMSLSLYNNVVNKNLFVTDKVPIYAAPGDKWFNTSVGILLIFIRDDNGVGFWIEFKGS